MLKTILCTSFVTVIVIEMLSFLNAKKVLKTLRKKKKETDNQVLFRVVLFAA